MDDKTAFNFGSVKDTLRGTAEAAPGIAIRSLGAAAIGAAVMAVPVAAQHIYDAATKRRDFRAMLRANADLADLPPEHVNAGFSMLRNLNPVLSKDPYVAASVVRTFAADPSRAFGVATQVLDAVPKPSMPGSIGRAFADNASVGVRQGLSLSDVPAKSNETYALEMAKQRARQHAEVTSGSARREARHER